MALVAGTLSRAGPLSSDILNLQVTEHGPDARVVTVVGEINAVTAPELDNGHGRADDDDSEPCAVPAGRQRCRFPRCGLRSAGSAIHHRAYPRTAPSCSLRFPGEALPPCCRCSTGRRVCPASCLRSRD